MTQHPVTPLSADTVNTLGELLDAGGRIARRHFYGALESLATADKGGARGYDPVTEADREIEALLRAGIAGAASADRIVGEEHGSSGPEDADRTWFLDPIDGTKAFLTGMTGWGTLVGVVERGRAIAGWMDQPVLGERFSAVDGRARLSRKGTAGETVMDLHVSQCSTLAEAIMYTTHPAMFGDGTAERRRYDDLGRAVRLQRFGGDCYAYCMLAAGRVDLVVEADLNSYDIVALIPIIEAAGGVITGPDGQQPLAGGMVVAAATPELAAQAWEMLSER